MDGVGILWHFVQCIFWIISNGISALWTCIAWLFGGFLQSAFWIISNGISALWSYIARPLGHVLQSAFRIIATRISSFSVYIIWRLWSFVQYSFWIVGKGISSSWTYTSLLAQGTWITPFILIVLVGIGTCCFVFKDLLYQIDNFENIDQDLLYQIDNVENIDQELHRKTGLKLPPIDSSAETRLLRLSPSSTTSKLRFELLKIGVKSLSRSPYTALSYHWGEAKRRSDVCEVSVGGSEDVDPEQCIRFSLPNGRYEEVGHVLH
jgi:hypothetical protein